MLDTSDWLLGTDKRTWELCHWLFPDGFQKWDRATVQSEPEPQALLQLAHQVIGLVRFFCIPYGSEPMQHQRMSFHLGVVSGSQNVLMRKIQINGH